MDICVDFDGTCVTHEFPKIGGDIGAVPVLRELVANGHNLILFTMRSDGKEPESYDLEKIKMAEMYLTDAVLWFKENGIELFGIQSNPSQSEWTSSPKAYAHLYIDDAALGCPLVWNPPGRPYADWEEIRKILIAKGVITELILGETN